MKGFYFIYVGFCGGVQGFLLALFLYISPGGALRTIGDGGGSNLDRHFLIPRLQKLSRQLLEIKQSFDTYLKKSMYINNVLKNIVASFQLG